MDTHKNAFLTPKVERGIVTLPRGEREASAVRNF
jgi:hypothetical protein